MKDKTIILNYNELLGVNDKKQLKHVTTKIKYYNTHYLKTNHHKYTEDLISLRIHLIYLDIFFLILPTSVSSFQAVNI